MKMLPTQHSSKTKIRFVAFLVVLFVGAFQNFAGAESLLQKIFGENPEIKIKQSPDKNPTTNFITEQVSTELQTNPTLEQAVDGDKVIGIDEARDIGTETQDKKIRPFREYFFESHGETIQSDIQLDPHLDPQGTELSIDEHIYDHIHIKDHPFPIDTIPTPLLGAQISASWNFSCVIAKVGGSKVYCWGENERGQLGNAYLQTNSFPNPVPAAVYGITSAIKVSTGGLHACALLSNGQVKCWGENYANQLGQSTTSASSYTPLTVIGINNAVDITTGFLSSYALLADGTIKCWGNCVGPAGYGSYPPILMRESASATSPIISNVTKISGNFANNILSILRGGAQLDINTTSGNSNTGLGGFENISTGSNYLCGSSCDTIITGTPPNTSFYLSPALKCWGDNNAGQVGNGSTTFTSSPDIVTIPGLTTCPPVNVGITTGYLHTCAIHSNNTYCWGANDAGQVGIGVASTASQLTPAPVLKTLTPLSPLKDLTQISAGYNHTCAVKSDSTIRCWGGNNRGQLGDSSTTQRTLPTVVYAHPITYMSAPTSHDFGLVQTGSSTMMATHTFTINNAGSGPTTSCSASLSNPTDFLILSNTCTSPLNVLDTCTVKVRSIPASVGIHTGTLTVNCSSPGVAGSTSHAASLQVEGFNVPIALQWTPTTKNFGNIYVGTTSATQTFTLTNPSSIGPATGCSPPQIYSTPPGQNNFEIVSDTCGMNNQPPVTAMVNYCTVEVKAKPTSLGVLLATLERNCMFGGTAQAGLEVTSLDPISLSPTSKNFNTVQVGATSTQTFTLTNNSGGPLWDNCTNASLATNAQFSLANDTCINTSLPPGGTCTVDVIANPNLVGNFSDSLTRTCTKVGIAPITKTASLQAEGVYVPISMAWTPSTKNFGNVYIGTNSATQIFTLTNPSASGPVTGCNAPVLSNTTDYQMIDNCGINDIPPSTSATNFCTVEVKATPTSAGTIPATITRSCTTGGLAVANLTTTSVNPITWTPTTKNFGTQLVGSSTSQIFTLSNAAGGPSLSGCSFATVNNSNFTVTTGGTCQNNSLPLPGGTCTVELTANPASEGLKTATLERSCSSFPLSPTASLQVIGNNPPPFWTPNTKNFATILVGQSSPTQLFTLTNPRLQDITGCSNAGISNTTGDFTVSNNTCTSSTLPASSTCSLEITANPQSSGLKSDTLSRVCTSISSPPTAAIQTTGSNPPPVWSPNPKNFGTILIGQSSPPTTLVLTNPSGLTLSGCADAFTTNTNDFTLSNNTCTSTGMGTSIPPMGGTCSVDVTANPQSAGSVTAAVKRTCGSQTISAQVTTTGSLPPPPAWTPNSKNFGTILLTQSSTPQTFTLENPSTGLPVSGCSDAQLNNSNFTLSNNTCTSAGMGTNMNPGATCTVDVTANPQSAGSITALLSRTCSGQAFTAQVTVNGGTPTITWTPSVKDFGPIFVGSTPQVSTFTFTSNISLTNCNPPIISPSTSAFTISNNNCNATTLAAGTSCTVDIEANPTSVGLITSSLSRTCNSYPVPTTAQLKVTGTNTSSTWSPGSYSFGSVPVGPGSSPTVFTFSNTGGFQLSGCSSPTISNTEFTITNNNCSSISTFNPGDSCTVDVTASPGSSGLKNATLSQTCSSHPVPATAQLTAQAFHPLPTWTPNTTSTPSTNYNFGDLFLGSSNIETFTYTIVGSQGYTGCYHYLNQNNGHFEILSGGTCQSVSTMFGGTSCTVPIKAHPTSAGLKTDTLVRSCHSSITGWVSSNISLNANGLGSPPSWSPNPHGFGSTLVGTSSAPQTFTLNNPAGGQNLSLCQAPFLSNSTDFSIVSGSDTCGTNNLGNNSSCTVDVIATPTGSGGTKTTTLERECGVFGLSGLGSIKTNISVDAISDLYWYPNNYNFGDAAIGIPSNAQIFSLNNTTTSIVTGCSAPTLTNSNDFEIVAGSDTCGANNLPALTGTCSVSVRAKPSSTGPAYTELQRSCSNGTYVGHLITHGFEPLEWTPTPHHFGSVYMGTPDIQTFALTNQMSSGNNTTNCSAATLSNTDDFTIINDSCGTNDLNAGDTCLVDVEINGNSAGIKNTTLTRSCTGGILAGSGGTSPNVDISAAILPISDFGVTPVSASNFGDVAVGSTSLNRTFTFSNNSTSTFTGCGVPILTNLTNFELTNINCPAGGSSLSSGGQCSVKIKAKPQSVGFQTATLGYACTGVFASLTVVANGTDPIQTSAWSPPRNFGEVTVSSNTPIHLLTLTNNASTPVSGCSAPALSNPTDFSIVSDTCITNSTMDPGATCGISVRGQPTTVGLKQTSVTRTCTGTTFDTPSNFIKMTGVTSTLLPSTHDFGSLLLNTEATKTFVHSNPTSTNMTSCGISTSGSSSSTFSIVSAGTTCGGTIAPGQSCNIVVKAKPTAPGNNYMTLSHNCSGGPSLPASSTMTVNGETTSFHWTSDGHDFGSVPVNTTTQVKTFVLTNSSPGTATGCSSPALSDSTNFSIVSDTCGTNSLPFGDSCTIKVKAHPTTTYYWPTYTHSSSLSRTCTNTGTTTYPNALKVTATGPNLVWTILQTHHFGQVPVGIASNSKQFTLQNQSSTQTVSNCSAPTLSNSNDFEIAPGSDTCGTSNMSPGSTCTVGVRAKPGTSGNKSTTLSRTCNIYGGTATTGAIQTEGVSQAAQWSPSSHSFGMMGTGNTSAFTFTLSNTGSTTFSSCLAPALTNGTDFKILSNNCGTNDVGPGNSCTVNVEASPTTVGTKSTNIVRICNQSPITIPSPNITVDVEPLSWTPPDHDFGNVTINTTSSPILLTLTNHDTLADATGCGAPVLSNSNDFEFIPLSDTCGTNSLLHGQSCSIQVRAKPLSTGGIFSYVTRACTINGITTTSKTKLVAFGASNISWNPSNHFFGTLPVNTVSTPVTFTLKNNATMTVSSCVPPSLVDPTHFEIIPGSDTCGNNPMASLATCTVSVRAKPGTSGSLNSGLSRTCSTNGGTAFTSLSVTGEANMSWTPGSHNFKKVPVGVESNPFTFTLKNDSSSLTMSNCSPPILGNPTDFEIVSGSDTCGNNPMAPLATCLVKVHAKPTSIGDKTTSLSRTCTTNGGTASISNYYITTKGIAPAQWSPNHHFGTMIVGDNVNAKTFTLTNPASGDSLSNCQTPTLTNLQDFTIVPGSNTCNSASMNPGDTCFISIKPTPTQAGVRTTNIVRICDLSSITLPSPNITVEAENLSWTPLAHDYGKVPVNFESNSITFTLKNYNSTTSSSNCSPPSITPFSHFEIVPGSDTCDINDLAMAGTSGDTCTVEVRAKPGTTGTHTATLSRFCAIDGGTAEAVLETKGISPALWSPTSYDFGSMAVGNTSADFTFALSNISGDNLTSCNAPTLTNTQDFTITSTSGQCAGLMPAGGACLVSVRANPINAGLRSTNIERLCDQSLITIPSPNITVTGTLMSWTPTTHSFGNIPVSVNSSPVTFTLQNNSTTDDYLGCGSPTLTNSNDFEIVSHTCNNNYLNHGDSCDVNVIAHPAVTSTGSITTQLSRTCSNGGGTAVSTLYVSALSANIGWNPLVKDFGNIPVGSESPTATFTLENFSSSPVSNCSALLLPNTADFTEVFNNCSGTTISGGSSCTIGLKAHPNSLGTRNTSLSITCSTNGGTANIPTANIKVIGISTNMSWNPSSHSFGNLPLGVTSVPQTFTLKNNDPFLTNSNCSAPTISNTADFEIVPGSDSCGTSNMAPGSTCTVNVRAQPSTPSYQTTDLTRTCTTNGGTVSANIQTTATSPATWSPTSYDFGNVTINSPSFAYAFTLTNPNPTAIYNCQPPTLTNTSGDFIITSDSCSYNSMGAPGSWNNSCTVLIKATPQSSGPVSTNINRVCGSGAVTLPSPNITAHGAFLTWSPGTHDFGNIPAGTQSTPMTFTLTNDHPVNTFSVCSGASISNTTHFEIVSDGCLAYPSMAPGTSCNVQVRAKPTTLGVKSTNLSLSCSPNGETATIPNIQVTAISPATWSPSTYAFGGVGIGASSTPYAFTLTNSNIAAMNNCQAPTLTNSQDFTIVPGSDTCGTNNLAAGSSCNVLVQAHPTSAGLLTTNIERVCGISPITMPSPTISVVGSTLTWGPVSKHFGNIAVSASSLPTTFTLTNSSTSSAPANFENCSAVTISNPADFTLNSNCTGTTMPYGSSCTVEITANPQGTGPRNTNLSRTCTIVGTTTTVSPNINWSNIEVTGTLTNMEWTPTSHAFGQVPVGIQSNAKIFTLKNTDPSTTYSGCGPISISNPSNFTVVTDGCSTLTSMAPGDSCDIILKASPLTIGNAASTISKTCTINGGTATTSYSTEGINQAQWSPLNHDFGGINVGSTTPSHTFTLTNFNPNPTLVNCQPPTLTNDNDFDIVTDNCGTNNMTSTGPGSTCTVVVNATPTTMGIRSTNISRICDQSEITLPSPNITVTGGYMTWSPEVEKFGQVPVGVSSAPKMFTLKNNDPTLTYSNCTNPTISNPADFEINTNPSSSTCFAATSLLPGETCTVQLRAKPGSVGDKDTALSRTCNTNGGTASIPLPGNITTTGIDLPTWSPANHNFGSVSVGGSSAGQTFALNNPNANNINLCQTPTLTDPNNFVIVTDNCGTSQLPAGGSCSVVVKAKPTSSGPKSTNINRICGGFMITTPSPNITTEGTSISWTPGTHNFVKVPVGVNSDPETFTLTNNDPALTASGCATPSTLTNSIDFEIVPGSDNCSTTSNLAPGASCTVQVRAHPSSVGSKFTSLKHTCTSGGTAIAAGVQAIGLLPAQWNQNTFNYGTLNVGTTSWAQTFMLTNPNSTSSLNDCQAPTLTNSTDFIIDSTTCTNLNMAPGGAGSCLVGVKAKPQSTGLKTTNITRTCGQAPAILVDITLSVTGQ